MTFNHGEHPKQPLPLILRVFAVLIGLLLFPISSSLWAEEINIEIKKIKLEFLAQVPPKAQNPGFKAVFKEDAFPLSAASNYENVMNSLNLRLSPAQKKHLEKHRFLILPKNEFIKFYADGYLNDEMIYNFDGIGGSHISSTRAPENALFVGPDPILHALHLYFSTRLRHLEETYLSAAAYNMLNRLYHQAGTLKNSASPESQKHWERLQAQFLVPLILLKSSKSGAGDFGLYSHHFDYGEEDNYDDVEKVFALLETYKNDFSAENAAGIADEIRKIYKAETTDESAFFLIAHPLPEVDYTQFKPRGNYANNSNLRSYFRAMIWLGQLGWDLRREEGLIDSLNFILAMSHEVAFDQGQPSTSTANPPMMLGALEAWKSIMELTTFFAGVPDEPTYADWAEYLQDEFGGIKFTPDTALDKDLLEQIRGRLNLMSLDGQIFKSLQSSGGFSPVLRVMPQRFTVPWYIADKITYKDEPDSEKLPVIFSGLWVPLILGSQCAEDLVERQVALNLTGGGPLFSEKQDAAPAELNINNLDQDQVKDSTETLKAKAKEIRTQLNRVSQESWFSTIGGAWFGIFGTLTQEYGQGYPLYMQSKLFPRKQLETLMASYTELKHDTILYEKPSYAESGEGGDDEDPPVPKGFVEPNLEFWQEMLRLTDYIAAGFAARGLFPGDLEEYGPLMRFKNDLEFCLTLSEKELKGETISDEDYERLRTLRLGDMAQGLSANMKSPEEARSGLVVDIQTANLNISPEDAIIVYEATAQPDLMLVLVGNENSPRLTIGLAFNHYEFTSPYGPRLTDEQWNDAVYQRYVESGYGADESKEGQLGAVNNEKTSLPQKNFWYEGLRP